ncbi:esterase/lipase family protein [Myxacorys almedinensis]|uniref:Alpha/beta fold hydrolase n=1 Tax=Myxacorys almedinensis A TaxID=2690445 RepID=A0A8J7Z4R3_9CYAN|nr:triacylglycerol lipase [Myxacorys almedinensis]NDJ16408.1 alpha/beta fold hydrolase [Myxacorys almedinensis A]
MNTQARNPVVLVHGITDTAAIFQLMTTRLKQLGWTVYSLDLIPANGDRTLDFLAHQLADFVNAKLPDSQPFDLIGFSMGGLVSRYYVQRLGGVNRVQRFITISSPHNGTLTAFLSQRPGCLQMRPQSAFLTDLNQDLSALECINFTSIWTPLDTMILPARSSQLPVGREMQVRVPLHAWMVTDSRAFNVILESLMEPVAAVLQEPINP